MNNQSSINDCQIAFDVVTNPFAQFARALIILFNLATLFCLIFLILEYKQTKLALHGNLKEVFFLQFINSNFPICLASLFEYSNFLCNWNNWIFIDRNPKYCNIFLLFRNSIFLILDYFIIRWSLRNVNSGLVCFFLPNFDLYTRNWHYFIPFGHNGWKNSCHFACPYLWMGRDKIWNYYQLFYGK